MVAITARNATDHRKRQARLKRGGGRVWNQAKVDVHEPDAAVMLGRVVSGEPSAEIAAMVAEKCRRRQEALGGPSYVGLRS